MDEFSINHLSWILFGLLILSAFFSCSETSMMAINRYRLKYLMSKNKRAKLTYELLERPDRLLGIILIGNNFVNIAASAIATIIGIKLYGDLGVVFATIILTIVVLIFGEITPKTIATIYPEKIALTACLPLKLLLIILFPLVWLCNIVSNSVLTLLGVNLRDKKDKLSLEELRTAVEETAGLVPGKHRRMLTSIIDLDKMTVNDIMVPRMELIGIDLNSDIKYIMQQLKTISHTLLPVYQEDINNLKGILHTRSLTQLLQKPNISKANIINLLEKPYFVPEHTTLNQQLINFQNNKVRLAFIVNEYGDLLGLITLEDLLEEIVGEFTTDPNSLNQLIQYLPDGSYLVDGSMPLKWLNQNLQWDLPIKDAKTISGCIIKYLESIPKAATCVNINQHRMEILAVQNKTIKTIKVLPLIHNLDKKGNNQNDVSNQKEP